MAFEARAEFWALSDRGDGVHAVVLDEAVADAQSWTALQNSVALPVAANGAPYAMSVQGVSGNCYVEVAAVPAAGTGLRARAVYSGKESWFIVKPGDKVWVTEIV